MTTCPRVSVLMSVFNGERFLREAVDSILRQTFEDFELVAVDDGSTDATRELLSSYTDPRVRVLTNPTNLGQAASLNRGLAEVTGIYVARHDADDLADSTRLAKQVAYLDAHQDAALVGSAWTEVDERGARGRVRMPPTDCVGIRWRLLFSNAFLHSSALLRRSSLDGFRYDDSVAYGEDYELWSRLARQFTVANLSEPLVWYRQSAASKTATIERAQAQVDEIAGANIDVVSGGLSWRIGPSPVYAAAARRLLLSADLSVDPTESIALAADLLELQRRFTRFFGLGQREAARHRARVASILGSRLRSIGRAVGDGRATRFGLRLLGRAAATDPLLLLGRHGPS